MPSLSQYKKFLGSHTDGEVRKIQSDEIIEWSWYEDIQSQTAYIYDYSLDDQPYEYLNLNSAKSKTKIPVEIKFIVNSHNSDSKDQVSYKIQFKPSFRWEDGNDFDWYKERFVNKYSAEFPIGNYIDIKDEKGNYRRWLITSEADWLDNQFPTWFVLPCDFCFRWVYNNNLYSMVGVSRSQNS